LNKNFKKSQNSINKQEGGVGMKKIDAALSKTVAKNMIIKGESWEKIMEETHLRLKDLKRIQRDEINPHF
jgi:DNA-directed RNA polymerase subunit H (RpoH/RPB5)